MIVGSFYGSELLEQRPLRKETCSHLPIDLAGRPAILSYLISTPRQVQDRPTGESRLQQQFNRIINREHFNSIACHCTHHTLDNMDREVQLQRASLSIALIRSGVDAPEVRREDAPLFLKTLHRTMNICTRDDVKVSEATSACEQAVKARQICAADKSSFRLAKTSLLGTFSRRL